MNRKLWLGLTLCVSWFLLAASGAGAAAPVAAAGSPGGRPAAARAAPQVPADTAYSLVASGATDYTIADPKVFWYSLPACTPIIHAPAAPTVNLYETIQRIPTYGGLVRSLFSRQVNFYCPSGQDVVSNIISDGSYLYWMSTVHNGLVKLSVDANLGDSPTLVSHAVSGPSQIVLAQGALFVLTEPAAGNSILWSINLSNGAGASLEDTGAGSGDFQTDNAYLYWINGGTLHEWDIHYVSDNGTLAAGVTGYHPLGQVVYIAQGASIFLYSNLGDPNQPIYTSSDSTNQVYSLAYDNGSLFWFEDHPIPCVPLCFQSHNDLLFRAGGDGSNPTQIYLFAAGTNPQASELRADASYLFWLENGAIKRLPENASALPDINLVADGLEVTQGIQDFNQDVPLIRDRDTYARFYVHSAGAAVPGVTAYLYQVDGIGNVLAGPLLPVNPAGQLLTVQSSPDRNNLNDSFLFELPYSWTETGSSPLYLSAVLNPNQDPLEPNYGDNTANSPGFFFQASPRLVVYFISWGYSLGGTTYYPRYIKDMVQTWSWVRRTYPIASAPGMLSDPTPGFRPNLWTIFDSGLGARVNQTAPECTDNLCASAYTNNLMSAMRTENSIPNNIFMYGMISDAAGIVPRGQACCGTGVSTGPAGSGTWGWDFDGSYADWYAGHEIGHTLGRAHPSASAALCGNSASDNSYPYPNGQIGPNTGAMEGFDVGDGSLGLPLAVYPGTSWYDVMSYCSNIWISDYTYDGMYNYMIAHPSAPAAKSSPTGALQAPALAGNWLAVYGDIVTGTNSAILTRVRHLSAVATIPPRVPGPYSIELFNAGNSLLASYPFTPDPATDDHPNWLGFTQVVTYVANTARLRIVRLADSATLATQAIPAHAPTVGNVTLVGAPNPVTGTVTLDWTSGDVDGNPLTFDIFYSRDGGATVQPLKIGVSGNSTPIDTTQLGGSGTALLRVVATDGVNTAQADSALFTMANKPPQPMILAPADGTHRHYGQLINFSGQALDAQDVGVDPSKLVWSDAGGTLGTGALLSISDLPVGTDVITLKATDSDGLSASTQITVIVDDNLNLPGPTLSVGPQQFAWSFASNAAAAQTALLKLDNVGGGSLSWTATTDAPWLKLSLASGTAPSQITLTASPSGLENGTAHGGHVFINVPAGGGSPAQQVVVPVNMSVGGSAANPALWAARLFLPLTRR